MDISSINSADAFAGFFAKDDLFPWLRTLIEQMVLGNICIDIDAFSESQYHNLSILSDHILVGPPQENKPFVIHNGRLYINRYFQYEKSLIEKIRQLCELVAADRDFDFLHDNKDFIVRHLFPPSGYVKGADWQLVACLTAFLSRFTIISGGPGTGKTTTVAKLLYLLLKQTPDAKIGVCAPTGKASAHLDESFARAGDKLAGSQFNAELVQKITDLKALTLHSMLGYIHNSIHFKHHEGNPLDFDILIVDECSMIDITMFFKLFKAIDPGRTRVVLLGDKNQLASVEAGSIFRDLCNDTAPMNIFSKVRTDFINGFIEEPLDCMSGEVTHPLFERMIELQTSFRFSDDEGIGKFSKAVLNNDQVVIKEFLENKDDRVKFLCPNDVESALKSAAQRLLQVNGGYVGQTGVGEALNRLVKSIVLCAVKEGKTGVLAVNRMIASEVSHNNERFYPFLPVMVASNQHSEGIYNGDMGLILEVKGEVNAYFPKGNGENLKLNPAQIREWEPAYAMTIHKSQGSEFDEVLIILPENRENILLTRELLYTAITRAKEKVTIVGFSEIIRAIAEQSVKRVSGIKDHFKS
ncbi:MAG: exodeoxyribonuclease V subunit alpha [Saprospiraceae bacterium]|nr:exodeoxyribonuclease V subunit alpha [Candidatus Parvibacillus calidus]